MFDATRLITPELSTSGAHLASPQPRRGAGPRAQTSRSRGKSSARLQGRVRASSWARMSFSQAVLQAPLEPGRQKTKVPLAEPARARDCRVEVPISSYDKKRNISPKPGITLSSRGV